MENMNYQTTIIYPSYNSDSLTQYGRELARCCYEQYGKDYEVDKKNLNTYMRYFNMTTFLSTLSAIIGFLAIIALAVLAVIRSKLTLIIFIGAVLLLLLNLLINWVIAKYISNIDHSTATRKTNRYLREHNFVDGDLICYIFEKGPDAYNPRFKYQTDINNLDILKEMSKSSNVALKIVFVSDDNVKFDVYVNGYKYTTLDFVYNGFNDFSTLTRKQDDNVYDFSYFNKYLI